MVVTHGRFGHKAWSSISVPQDGPQSRWPPKYFILDTLISQRALRESVLRVPVFQPPAGVRSSLGGRRRGHWDSAACLGQRKGPEAENQSGLQERPPFGWEIHWGAHRGYRNCPSGLRILLGTGQAAGGPPKAAAGGGETPRGLASTGPLALHRRKREAASARKGAPSSARQTCCSRAPVRKPPAS